MARYGLMILLSFFPALAFGAEGGAAFFLKPGGGAGAALRDFMPAGGGSLTVEDCENEEERHHRLVSA